MGFDFGALIAPTINAISETIKPVEDAAKEMARNHALTHLANINSIVSSDSDEGLKDPGPSFIGPSQDSLTAISDKYYPENIPKPGTPVDQSTWPGHISPQDRALLDTISFAEGTWNGSPRYDLAYNYNTIDINKPHPDIVFKGDGIDSAASGAYQFMPQTWINVNKGENIPMTPRNQDDAALLLAKGTGWDGSKAFGPQAHKLAGIWASFPTITGAGAYPDQGPKPGDGKLGKLNNFYNQRLNLLLGR